MKRNWQITCAPAIHLFLNSPSWQCRIVQWWAPFEVPANAFMGIELVKGALETGTATVQYPKEFDSVC